MRAERRAGPMNVAARAETLSALLASTVVGVVRSERRERAEALARALVEGGMRAVEITATTPGAFEIVADLVIANPPPTTVLGIGTVRTEREVDRAQQAGARFVVSPHTDKAIIQRAVQQHLVSIPGAMTPTEILAARAAGADIVKVFPIDAVGKASFVRRLKGPLPDVPLWVSGDVAISEIDGYLEAGVSLIGLTSALTADLVEPLDVAVKARAKSAIDAVARARAGAPLLTFLVEGRRGVVGLKELRRLPGSEHTPLESVVSGRRGHAVRMRVLLESALVPREAKLEVVSADGFVRPVDAAALFEGGFLHYATDGHALSVEEGGPLRLYIVGGDSQCDNVKGLAEIRVVA